MVRLCSVYTLTTVRLSVVVGCVALALVSWWCWCWCWLLYRAGGQSVHHEAQEDPNGDEREESPNDARPSWLHQTALHVPGPVLLVYVPYACLCLCLPVVAAVWLASCRPVVC